MSEIRENLKRVAAGASHAEREDAVIAVESETILKNGVILEAHLIVLLAMAK